jgi:hypothetical protein
MRVLQASHLLISAAAILWRKSMAGWLVATLRGYLGRDAYVDNPAHVSLTLHPQISSSNPVGRRGGALGNGRARIGSGSRSFPARYMESPSQRNDRTHHFILEMVIILLSSTSEILPWPTF